VYHLSHEFPTHGNDALTFRTEAFESSDRQVNGIRTFTSGAFIHNGHNDGVSVVGSDLHLLTTMGSIVIDG
jgi:hypothetical protein